VAVRNQEQALDSKARLERLRRAIGPNDK
jgi:hypothetical protein